MAVCSRREEVDIAGLNAKPNKPVICGVRNYAFQTLNVNLEPSNISQEKGSLKEN